MNINLNYLHSPKTYTKYYFLASSSNPCFNTFTFTLINQRLATQFTTTIPRRAALNTRIWKPLNQGNSNRDNIQRYSTNHH